LEIKWLQISLIYFPVTVLGIGERVGLWTQGCSIRCKGCMSKHTWDFNGGERIYFNELFEKLKSFNCKRITISGGEPFEQKYFLDFLKELRTIFNDIFVYSGFEWDYIKNNFSEHLKYIDAIVCGRFIEGKESEYLYKGSDNQELIILNENLFDEYIKFKQLKKDKKLQIVKNKYIIGIPYQNDLKKLKELNVI
jgi:anaerobic ribonucleoside-triphosphate reductase activating protein